MSGGKSVDRGQPVRAMPIKRDLARSALAFGRSGGCSAGCELCRFYWLCEGGEIGADTEETATEERKP